MTAKKNRYKVFHTKFASASANFPPSFSRIAIFFFFERATLCALALPFERLALIGFVTTGL